MPLKFIKTNVGFYNSKTIRQDGSFEVYKTMTQPNTLASSQYIQLDSTKYQVGVGQRSVDDKLDSKTHLLCTYYNVLANCDNGDEVVLITLLPMKNYINDDYVKVYKQMFLSSPILKGNVNGQNKVVTIRDVVVYMEGASAVNLYDDIFDDRTVGLIDIGGNTINAAVFTDGEIQLDTCHTMPLGTIKLERSVIDILDSELNWSTQPYEIPELLMSDDVKIKKLVDKVCTTFVNNIYNNLLEYNWNLQNLRLFATGGGSKLLQKYLEERFDNITFSKEPIFDNVKGLLYIEEMIASGYEKMLFA